MPANRDNRGAHYRRAAGTPATNRTGARRPQQPTAHAPYGSQAASRTRANRATGPQYTRTVAPSSYAQGRRSTTPEPKRKNRAGLIVGIIVLLALVGGGAALAMHLLGGSGSSSTETATKSDSSSKSSSTENSTGTDAASTVTDDPGEIVMGVNGNEHTIVLKGEEYLEAGAHAAEPTDGILNNKIETSGTVDTSKAGTYTVTYSVSDSTGHRASIERTVEVVNSMDKQQNGIPILMYHDVHEDGDTSQTYDANNISTAALDEQLAYLTSNNFYFASFQEVKAFIEGTHSLPAKSIVLTFDDAAAGFLDHGIPVIEKYQVPVTSFCIGMYDQGNSVSKRSRYVEYESHSYKMHQGGGSSGHGGLMTSMTTDQILEDLQKEAEELQANNAFAYPFGDVPETGVEAVKKAGIACGFTTVNAWAKIGDDPAQLPRVRVNAGVDINSYASSVTG